MKADDIAVCRRLAEQYIESRGGGTIERALGDGGSAAVFLWRLDEQQRALKVYDPKFLASDAAPAERYRLSLQERLIGQHCDSIADTLSVEEALGTCFVAMQFFPGEQLKVVIASVPNGAVPVLMGQLVAAVRFLEQYQLVHRDIKPENILVNSEFSRLCLIDLGVVREISTDEDRGGGTDHGLKRPFIATAQYSSPEYLFRLVPPSNDLWQALTIYQLGGVLHDLVCKKPLFLEAVATDNKYALAMSVLRDTPDFSGAHPDLSHWAALAARCLVKSMALRLQLVGLGDFEPRAETPTQRLQRALKVRAVVSMSADRATGMAQASQQGRLKVYAELRDELQRRLIADHQTLLRISQLGSDEARFCFFARLADVALGVRLAVEHTWSGAEMDETAAVRIAAFAAINEHDGGEFNGERLALGELHLTQSPPSEIVTSLVDSVSELLLKHVDLSVSGAVSSGMDLVAVTWPNNVTSTKGAAA